MSIFVNDVEITDDEVYAEMQYHPAPSVDAARYQAAHALVVRQLLLQAAHDKNLLPAPEQADVEAIEAGIGRLIQQEVSVPEADESSCKRYYEQNLDRFKDKDRNQVVPFENVHLQIQDYLHTRSLRTGVRQYIMLLAGQAHITGFELEGSDTPLVQ